MNGFQEEAAQVAKSSCCRPCLRQDKAFWLSAWQACAISPTSSQCNLRRSVSTHALLSRGPNAQVDAAHQPVPTGLASCNYQKPSAEHSATADRRSTVNTTRDGKGFVSGRGDGSNASSDSTHLREPDATKTQHLRMPNTHEAH